jgi:hypothetical protein
MRSKAVDNWRGEFVTQAELDYQESYRRGGHNCGDEDFALFKRPFCGRIYLMDYELDTVYLEGHEFSQRVRTSAGSFFNCVQCGRPVPQDGAWVGPRARPRFQVTWSALAASDWFWTVKRLREDRK